MEHGIDGWRLDVPSEITTPGFWEEFRRRTKAINPDVYLVGEIWRDASKWTNDGDRFDATMNYLFGQAAISFAAAGRVVPETVARAYYRLTDLDASGFAAAVHGVLDRYTPEANSSHLNLVESHDVPRLLTVAGGDTATVKLAAALLLTYPGAPCIYYGGEVGMAGEMDPGCRAGFPWDGEWNADVLDTYRSLIALRRAHPALRSLDYRAEAAGDRLVLIHRRAQGAHLVVAVNAGDAAASVGSSVDDVLWGSPNVDGDAVAVAPRSAAVWSVTGG